MGVLVNGLEVVKGLPSVGGGMPAQQASPGGGLDEEGIQAQDMSLIIKGKLKVENHDTNPLLQGYSWRLA